MPGGFNERRTSTDTYTPCGGLFPSHKFKGPLATHYVILIYGGQIVFITGIVLAVIGFTADVLPMAYFGPIVGSVGLCMAAAGCTVHRRSANLRQRRIGTIPNGDTFNPDSVCDVYKQLAASACCMGALLGIIFLAIGLANGKNEGDDSLTLYFEIMGPIFIVLGVAGLIAIKCSEAKARKRTKRQSGNNSTKLERRTLKVHMATHTTIKSNDTDTGVDDNTSLELRTISGQARAGFHLPGQTFNSDIPLEFYPAEDIEVMPIDNERATGKFERPVPSRVITPAPPSDSDTEIQSQWQNAYTLTTRSC